MAAEFSSPEGLELTPSQREAMEKELARFILPTRKRGEAYLLEGRVQQARRFEHGFVVRVQGSLLYSVQWVWGRARWQFDCNCPIGPRCKHTYAAGRWLLAQEPHVLAPKIELEHASRRLVRDLLRDPDPWDRRQVVRQLFTGPEFRQLSAYDPQVEEILGEQDVEVLCWRLAQWAASRTGGVIPTALSPFYDRPDMRRAVEQRERHALGAAILAWTQVERRATGRTLRFVWTLVRRGDAPMLLAEARLTSVKLNDSPRTLAQLRVLVDEVREGTSDLSPDAATLLDTYADSCFVDRPTWTPTGREAPSETCFAACAVAMVQAAGGPSNLMVWSDQCDPELAAMAGIEPGTPLRLAELGVAIQPTVTPHDSDVLLDLACVSLDGSARRLADTVYFPGKPAERRRGVVVFSGQLHRVTGEPPSHIVARYRSVGGVPLDAAASGSILAPLVSRFRHVRQAMALRIRTISGAGLVVLDLREDDWLQVRVIVHDAPGDWMPHEPAPAGSTVLELQPDDSWRSLVASTAVAGVHAALPPPSDETEAASGAAVAAAEPSYGASLEDAWLVEPEPRQAEALRAWVQRLGATPGMQGRPGGHAPSSADRGVGWWMFLSGAHVAHLAAAWEERPRGITFVGNHRIRRLLTGGATAWPKIEIRSSGVDWFSVSAQWESEGLALSEADMRKLQASEERFVRLSSGWVRRDVAQESEAAANALADLGIEVGAEAQKITLWQLAGTAPESVEQLLSMTGGNPAMRRAVQRLRQAIERFEGLPEVPLPAGLQAEMRPYQKKGLDFLAHAASIGLGAVLADDMGLGKTLQALAWVQHLVEKNPRGGPTLVVCPTSVMHNWAREAARFTPGLRVLVLERGQERHVQRLNLRRYDLVVTNYTLLRIDLDAWRESKLRAVILDEAQNIKNPDAAVSKAVFTLDAKHRLALTGTPVENRPLDLWSLSQFVNPGYLGDRATFVARHDRLDAPLHTRKLLAAKMRPVLLRRLKREVATDLPERIEERRDCEMTEGQRRLYLTELRRSRRLVDELSADPATLRKNRIMILAALTRLRQVCCHPALAKGAASLGSGKFDAFFELLEPLLDEGHKVLVFSQFVQCLALLDKALRQRGVKPHLLTGASTKRDRIVADFQEAEGAGVFLISLKAGGTGLNLTAANYVVLFDPWWNPSVEAQAIDRTHRIGQDRTVIAYRMITEGTIEERIWELQQRKAQMVRDILGEDGFARALTRDDLAYLLEM